MLRKNKEMLNASVKKYDVKKSKNIFNPEYVNSSFEAFANYETFKYSL